MRASVLLLLASCQSGLDAPASSPDLDPNFFRCRVQPILVRSCATFACHGDARRFFRVYGRSRLRYGVMSEAERNVPLGATEIDANYRSAREFTDPAKPDNSLLLLKPLEGNAGGYFHQGAEVFDQGNVYERADDPELEVIRRWIRGEKEDPTCVEPGSNL